MYFTNKKLSPSLAVAMAEIAVVFNGKKSRYEVAFPQVDRSDYLEFKKILEEIGGKWDGSRSKIHFFDRDPSHLFKKIIEIGLLPERKPHDAFFTPREVVKNLLEYGDFWFFDAKRWSEKHEYHQYLEPQAGQGSIAEVIQEIYPEIPQIDCCEIEENNRAVLAQKGFNFVGEDFLNLPPNPVYRWVTMNPPFKGKRGDYIDHIKHAFKFLESRGRLLAIAPASFLSSTNRRVVDFRNWVFTYGGHARLPEKSFASSGTNVECVMLRIDNLPDSQIEELETLGSLYDFFDSYTGGIAVALSSDSAWYECYRRLIERTRRQEITSRAAFLKEVVRDADNIVREHILRYEADFRWDDFTKARFAEYWCEDAIEEFFEGRSPFEEPATNQTQEIESGTAIQLEIS